jgi:hypothetical protein
MHLDNRKQLGTREIPCPTENSRSIPGLPNSSRSIPGYPGLPGEWELLISCICADTAPFLSYMLPQFYVAHSVFRRHFIQRTNFNSVQYMDHAHDLAPLLHMTTKY